MLIRCKNVRSLNDTFLILIKNKMHYTMISVNYRNGGSFFLNYSYVLLKTDIVKKLFDDLGKTGYFSL